jgi:KaiC/GvpD/RAD55 family RecA-like ATPase
MEVTSSIKRISSGIEGLDSLILGGLPEGTSTMIYGGPKAGKSVFAFHSLNESIRSKESCLFVMTDYVLDDLFLATQGFGWPIQRAIKEDSIHVIDMSSTHSDKPIEPASSSTPLRFASLANPTDLMAQSTDIVKLFALVKFRTVLDSLTSLFVYNPPMIVAKVLRQFAQRMKGAGSGGLIVTYTEGSVDPQSEIIMKSSVDNLVHLKDGELTIEGMVGTPRVRAKYEIQDSGMKVSP